MAKELGDEEKIFADEVDKAFSFGGAELDLSIFAEPAESANMAIRT